MLTLTDLWPPPLPATLPVRHTHVWHASLSQPPATIAALAGWLNPAEEARAARFHFEHHRQHFIVGRGLLRLLLSHYLDLAPGDVQLVYTSHSKPHLPGGQLQFNLSHAGERVVYAFARDRALGVDIEQLRALPDAESIARRFFAPAEAARFMALPAPLRPAGFFNCWTRKEAFIKAVGEGLSYPLDIFEVTLAPDEPARLIHIQGSEAAAAEWDLQVLHPETGYVAALVVAGAKKIGS